MILSSDDDFNKVQLSFNPTQLFSQYNFNYLYYPILYKFKKVVSMKKSKFNFLVKNISAEDKNNINRILQKIKNDLQLKRSDAFMSHKNMKTTDTNGKELMTSITTEKQYQIKILISGYKTNENGISSPIWRLLDAKLL